MLGFPRDKSHDNTRQSCSSPDRRVLSRSLVDAKMWRCGVRGATDLLGLSEDEWIISTLFAPIRRKGWDTCYTSDGLVEVWNPALWEIRN